MLPFACVDPTDDPTEVDDLYHFALAHENDLRLSAYITVHAVQGCFSDADSRREAVSVLRSFGITKTYLETYRSGDVADAAVLEAARDFLIANGFKVAGGIASTPGKDFGVRQNTKLGWYNYEHPKTQSDLETVVRLTARTFDEMIIDDFLCSADTSEISQRAKGDRSWSQYRMDLLSELSERLFVKIAREENPDIITIIKYPQWYDRFHLHGYDVVREPAIYDKVWIGTETRGPDTQRMGFVKQYEGYVNFRWLSSCAPDKIGGAWFDHIDCTAYDFFDQAVQTVLAGAKEIMFFNFYDLIRGHAGHHLLRRGFPKLVQLAQMVQRQAAQGAVAYKPAHSDAGSDYYIFDYMGMIGIPMLPTSTLSSDAAVTFLPTHAAKDTELPGKIKQRLQNGKTVVVTAGLLKHFADNTEIIALAGVACEDMQTPATAKKLLVEEKAFNFEQGLDLELNLKTKSAKAIVVAQSGQARIPVLTVNEPPSGGRMAVLNLPTFSDAHFDAVEEELLAPIDVSWLDLPAECLNLIRDAFLNPLGLSLQAPGRVSFHPYGEDNWVICNFNNQPVQVELAFKTQPLTGALKNKLTGDSIPINQGQVNLTIGTRQFLWLEKQLK
ncbi:hypothetical protein JXJ21_10685 [candidate division KSB1 bacterium]|nr:hypothetical protein [candidate division KSB1 bacterium]